MVNVLIHPVGTACNLSCEYCFYRHVRNAPPSRSFMSEETFSCLMNNFSFITNDDEKKVIDLIWHGGEPLLRGYSFYDHVADLSQYVLPKNLEIHQCLQTNGTMIDKRWASLFKKRKILVGVSIDGTQRMHDMFRRGHSRPSFAESFRGLQILQDADVPNGIVTVVHRGNVSHPDEVFEFLQESGSPHMQLSACFECGSADDFSVTPEEYSRFVCRLFDLWIAAGDPDVTIAFIDEIVNFFLGKEVSDCLLGDQCDKFVVLDWDGTIRTCSGLGNCGMLPLGNIHTDSLPNILGNTSGIELYCSIHKQRLSVCSPCEWYGLCHGGCPYHWLAGQAPSALCLGYRQIFEHIGNTLLKCSGGSV